MLCRGKIISLFCFLDDLLKAMGHTDDHSSTVSAAEILTTSFLAATNYGGHLNTARLHMLDYGFVPAMISESRFNRRLHRLAPLLEQLFLQIGAQLKAIAGADDDVPDSFPVVACAIFVLSRAACLKASIGGVNGVPCAVISMALRCRYLSFGDFRWSSVSHRGRRMMWKPCINYL